MTRFFLYALVLLLGLNTPALATAPPPATGRPLAEALNPDGTLRPGANGSFDARQFRMQTAPDGRPVFRPAGTTGAGDERWQDGFGVLNGTDGTVRAVVQAGAAIYIGGDFTAVGSIAARGIARWNGTAWSSLGTGTANGVNGPVYALAVAGNGDVYAGGYFSRAGGVSATNVAKWNGTAWSRMGAGMSGGATNGVLALAVTGSGDVYAGGDFRLAGGIAANYIAKWNGTAWSSLGTGADNGTNYYVKALAVAGNGDVYIGGLFSQAGSVAANRVAKWNGTAWSSMGNWFNSTVHALVVAGNGDVYAGGEFWQTGVSTVAKWNGTAWSALGSGTSNSVYALAVAGNGDVYVGGTFTQAGSVAANRVAKWNGTTWSSLGTGAANGVAGDVNGLAVAGNGDVYAGGQFPQTGGVEVNYIGKWNGSAWNALNTGTANGVDGTVLTVAVASNGDAFIGGTFARVGGIAANNVAKWNGTAWSSLGTGTANGVNGYVYALAVAGNGDVYAGGLFTQAGVASAYSVAKWNGTTWSSLGTGMSASVRALAVASNGDVYAGGQFTQADNVIAYSVAKWNGTTWSSLGTGAANGLRNATVLALVVAGNGDVYVGGTFTQAGGIAANNVAKWDGTAWSNLGTGLVTGVSNGAVYALAIAGNGDVYAGGNFSQAGSVMANSIAKWNGTAWSNLGPNTAGLGDNVLALAVASNGDVYAGGQFTQAGGAAVNYVGKWNGTAWSSLGTSTNGQVNKLAVGPTGKLYAGGIFTSTGDYSKAMVHFAIYDPNTPLGTTAAKAAPAAQLFPNPAHGTATLRLPAGAPRLPLILTDALGRTVRRYPAPAASADAELDLRGLPAGAYVVRCGEFTQRLVVE
ncbi:hypothetical protein [Hymenobacter negativus]|uniref:T9SS type A sorting domain-containing protein n=1 Tax=Hymenobacter negativus TaxID=2795026 RepID=A0ABS3QF61_9BACT|nr:hypothetical protein [Hymenobacter negativus]MBO2009355.1 hypothetical protein [Hymenobacter negativus]